MNKEGSMSEEKKLTPAQKEIDEAYKLISALQASGDTVDLIASVRVHLRKAYELAEEKAEPAETKEKKDG